MIEKTPPSPDPQNTPPSLHPLSLSLSFPGKEGKKKLKENQWWVGKWVGWVRAWAEPATHVGTMVKIPKSI
jgi:hypothetical protein